MLMGKLTFDPSVTPTLPWTNCLKHCLLSSNTLGKTDLTLLSFLGFTSDLNLDQLIFGCVFCRLRSVIGLGVGAGAYILARFAVSLNLLKINKAGFMHSLPFLLLIFWASLCGSLLFESSYKDTVRHVLNRRCWEYFKFFCG